MHRPSGVSKSRLLLRGDDDVKEDAQVNQVPDVRYTGRLSLQIPAVKYTQIVRYLLVALLPCWKLLDVKYTQAMTKLQNPTFRSTRRHPFAS